MSYSLYRTGTSLQWRLRGGISLKRYYCHILGSGLELACNGGSIESRNDVVTKIFFEIMGYDVIFL